MQLRNASGNGEQRMSERRDEAEGWETKGTTVL
jgi:hypothetical protein